MAMQFSTELIDRESVADLGKEPDDGHRTIFRKRTRTRPYTEKVTPFPLSERLHISDVTRDYFKAVILKSNQPLCKLKKIIFCFPLHKSVNLYQTAPL